MGAGANGCYGRDGLVFEARSGASDFDHDGHQFL